MDDSTLLQYSWHFAKERHGDQKWSNDMPYCEHLKRVGLQVAKWSKHGPIDTEWACKLVAAAFLHDVLEDTNTTPEEIRYHFGTDILMLVQAVTNDTSLPTRKERSAASWEKIKVAHPYAKVLKLCDRYVNIEESAKDKSSRHFKMYLKEHHDFKAALYNPGQFEELWDAIDEQLTF